MEVAQIGNGIVNTIRKNRNNRDIKSWLPSKYLIEAICLAHDIGHPPFGHSGEVALNYAMHNFGGFEGNGQTLRVLTYLESHTESAGLNLTRRSLLGILKYPNLYHRLRRRDDPSKMSKYSEFRSDDWHPPKCVLDADEKTLEWILSPFSHDDRNLFMEYEKPDEDKPGKTLHKSLDCSIMDCADDISYGVHDLEDAIALNFFARDDWDEWMEGTMQKKCPDWVEEWKLNKIADDLFKTRSKGCSHKRKQAIGKMVNALINSVGSYEKPDFEEPILRYRVGFQTEAEPFIKQLKKAIEKCVIKSHSLITLRHRNQRFVIDLFKTINSDPVNLLTPSYKNIYENETDEKGRARIVCDYIAGMTDDYAARIYERLFIPRSGSVFERL